MDEDRLRVTFEIEPQATAVRLTVVHDGLASDSVLRNTVSEAWPALLASLTTTARDRRGAVSAPVAR